MGSSPASFEVYLREGDLLTAMRDDVRHGLRSTPKWLPPKYFYDERGSLLFEQITRLPEYYPTRAEREILDRHSDRIAQLTTPVELLELGAGAAKKTRLLIEAGHAHGSLTRYTHVDVSETMARQAVEELQTRYPGLEIRVIVADFERHLGKIEPAPRRMVALLGSTIGNLNPDKATDFLHEVKGLIQSDGFLLLGTDLVKDRRDLEAAYDDSQGVTAEFNLNVLRVINDRLGGHFDPGRFKHVAFWNEPRQRIEMHLESTTDQRITIDALDMEVAFAAGERMQTEVSCKYTRSSVERIAREAGLRLEQWFTDAAGRFALSLSRPR